MEIDSLKIKVGFKGQLKKLIKAYFGLNVGKIWIDSSIKQTPVGRKYINIKILLNPKPKT